MKRHYITAVIAIALEIINFITEVIDGRFTDGIHDIIFILLFMLTIAAFKRPTIPFAIAIAAIGSFLADICVALRILVWIKGALSPSVISPATADGIGIAVYCCVFILGINDAFHSAEQIQIMQKENFEGQYQSAAVSRSVDEKAKLMVKYLRPDYTGFNLMIAAALMGEIMFFIISLSEGKIETEALPMHIGLLAPTCIFAGIAIWVRKSYQSYIKQLSDSGELSRMAEDFTHGTRYWDNEIVLGEHYIFGHNNKIVHKYSDIAKIYQRWSNVNTMRRSPWWHMRVNTIDGSDQLLAYVPYRYSEENFQELALPVILAIRSKNSKIVIG